MSTELESAGFTIVPGAIDEQSRNRLLRAVLPELSSAPVRHRSGEAFAARAILWKSRILGPLLDTCGVTSLASSILGRAAFAIDAVFFDKHVGANWTVPGHQDRVLPVAEGSTDKYRNRNGIAYAEVDPKALAELIALRIHFDLTDSESGALCVVPGSHLRGVMTSAQILEVSLDHYQPCLTAPGDVLAMRPLLLHRSSPFKGEGQRRVLHVVYATGEPTNGVRWRRSAQQGVAAVGLLGRFAPSGIRR